VAVGTQSWATRPRCSLATGRSRRLWESVAGPDRSALSIGRQYSRVPRAQDYRQHVGEVWIEDLGQISSDDPRTAIVDILTDAIPKVFEALPIPIGDGSRMAEDKIAAPDLLDLPQLCEHYLGCSEDHLLAIRLLMQPRPNTLQLTRFAIYPLIRAVMESSGQVVWVLGAEDREERFRRMLRLQKFELDSDRRYVDALTRPRDDDSPEFWSFASGEQAQFASKRQMRWRRLLDAGNAIGLVQSDFEHGLSIGYEGMIREAADEQNLDRDFRGRQCASIWTFISGLGHPSVSRAWAGSINEPGEVGPDGTMFVRSEANPAVVRDALGVAMMLHVRAILLWKQASATPSPRPESDAD
jgi:hypothetical protein